MYNELREEYREALLNLTSSLKTDGSDKIDLVRLFIRIGDDITLKNSSGSRDLKYYNDAAIHYIYAINISKKLLESQRNESTILLLQPIIAESEAKLKELHSIILDQITSDTIIGDKLETVKESFSLDEVSNKSYIYGLREYVNSRLQEINKYYGEIKDSIAYAAESTALFEEIAGRMKVYFTELLDSSTFIVEAAPCKYTILGLGSMTMRHMTPYSDLEFAILTEHDEYKTSIDPKVSNYFKNLSHYINFKVICLGETTIANSIYGLNLDDLGRRGINFDLGGKTSLGRSDKDYDLVCTVDQMLEYLRGNYPVTEERRRDDKLEHILENTCYICGNDGGYETSLLKEYQIRAREYLLSISIESRYTYCFDRGVKVLAGDIKEAEENLSFSAQTRGDLERFQFNPFKDEGKIFDVKQEVYRLPDRLIYNLGLIYGLTATANGLSDIEIIDGLLSKTIINEEAAIHLKETISYANMLRLRAYDFYGQQQETMDITPEGGLSLSKVPNFRISHNEVSEDGAFFRYYYTAIELHQYLTDLCEWQKRSLDTVPLTFEQIESYFVDKSFYEPTSANKAKVCLRLSMYELQSRYELEYYESTKTKPLEQISSAIRLVDVYDKLNNKSQVNQFLDKAIFLLSKLDDTQRAIFEAEINDTYVCIHLNEATEPELNRLNDLCDKSISIKLEKGIVNIWKSKFTKASILYRLNKKEEAAKEYKELILLHHKVIGEKNGIIVLNNLAGIYIEIGNHHEAKSLINRALELAKHRFGEESPEIVPLFYTKGWILLNHREYKTSIESFKKVLYYQNLTVQNKALTLKNLGNALSLDDQYDEAISKIKESLVLSQSIEGEKNLYQTYSRAGNFYHQKNDHSKALEYQEKALQISKAIFGENHPDTATSYNNVGSTYVELGKHSKALKYLTKALEINKAIFGENHPDTATSYDNVGSTYMKYNPEEALKYFLKGCSINTKFGIPISSGISVFLGESEQSAHRECIQYFLMPRKHKINYIKAIKSAEKALSIKKAIYGEESATVIQFLSYLHNQYIKLPENLKSQTWVKEWVDLMHFGLQRPITNFTEIPEHIDSESIRVVSYNICADFFDNKDKTVDSHHHWSIRSTYVIKLLSQVTPDIMCLQELSAEQASNLTIAFRDKFESIFLSQTPSEVEPTGAICYGEDVASWTDKKLGTPLIGIFVNRNTNWKIVSEKTGRFWLNELPDEIPVSYDRGETDKGFGNMNTYRAILWCMVINIDTEKTIYIFNSHYPLNGNSETRFKCAELERAKIKEITGDAKWISAGDRNLIKCDDDNLHYNPLTIYKTLTKDVHDLRDHRPDKHYGISGTWLGFTYDQHKSRIGTSSADVLDVMVSNLKPVQSFFHPGIFNFADGTIIPLSNYADSSLLDSYNESRYFASDHVLLGADLCFE